MDLQCSSNNQRVAVPVGVGVIVDKLLLPLHAILTNVESSSEEREATGSLLAKLACYPRCKWRLRPRNSHLSCCEKCGGEIRWLCCIFGQKRSPEWDARYRCYY